MIATQPEFQGFPATQRDAEHRSFTDQFESIAAKVGPLVPQNVISAALGVSKARVSQFLQEGRFHVYELAGTKFVPLAEVAAHAPRPTGRPKQKEE